MLIHSEVVLFEIASCLVLPRTILSSRLLSVTKMLNSNDPKAASRGIPQIMFHQISTVPEKSVRYKEVSAL